MITGPKYHFRQEGGKTEKLNIRVSPEMKARLKARAKKTRKSLGQIVRECVRAVMGEEMKNRVQCKECKHIYERKGAGDRIWAYGCDEVAPDIAPDGVYLSAEAARAWRKCKSYKPNEHH